MTTIYRLRESKDSIINKMVKNGNISTSEGETLKTFFNKYSVYESRIDWNKWKSLTFDDFKNVLVLENKSVSAIKKRGVGIEGLDEGRDYLHLGSGTFKRKKMGCLSTPNLLCC